VVEFSGNPPFPGLLILPDLRIIQPMRESCVPFLRLKEDIMHKLLRISMLAALACLVWSPTNADAAIGFSYQETAERFEFRIEGEDIRDSSLQEFDAKGAFWDVRAIVFENAKLGESVFVKGTARHIVGPDAGDAPSTRFEFGAALFPLLPPLIVGDGGTTNHPNGHSDVYAVMASVDGTLGDVTDWDFSVSGSHVVPEPGTLAVWSILGITVVGLGHWRRRRAKV
jgi:hypothetical protein